MTATRLTRAELATLRALLELRTRERDTERERCVQWCDAVAEIVLGHASVDAYSAVTDLREKIASGRALLNTKGNDHER